MKYIQLQNEVMKAADKEILTGKKSTFSYGFYEKDDKKYIGIVINKIAIVFIPENKFFLDIDKVFPDIKPIPITKMINTKTDSCVVTETDGLIKPFGNLTVQIFNNEYGDIYLSTKLLKYFDLDVCNFLGGKKNMPVYVFDYETLEGMILPIVHNDKED